jgi:hypothetical protein
MDSLERKGRSTGGWIIAAVIGFIALAALVGAFRPQIAQAWGSLTGPSEEQQEDVRTAVERYAEAQDMADGEFSKVRDRLEGGIVTERYWSSEEGSSYAEGEGEGDGTGTISVRFAANRWLAGWSLEECCAEGARGVAEIGSDSRMYDLETPDESTPFLEGSYKLRVELVEQDGRWKVAWVEEIKDGDK